jgi:membrane-bound metal-dependent hydrolase YbcI (DUF457 family)
MSVGAFSRTASRPLLLDWRLIGALLGALIAWQAADLIEAHAPLSPGWAVVDEVGHASVAAFILLWTWPAWGWRPTVAAICAGTLIDVDHALAAHSLLPMHMMSLEARPAGHSLLGVGLATTLGTALGGRRIGFAAGVGVLSHIARDAQAQPGVPLLVPWSADWHVMLPAWGLPLLMFLLAAIGLAASRLIRLPWRKGS